MTDPESNERKPDKELVRPSNSGSQQHPAVADHDHAAVLVAARDARKPVLAILHATTRHARLIHKEIKQGHVKTQSSDDSLLDGCWNFLLDPRDLSTLLRRHCESAGVVIADRLDIEMENDWSGISIDVLRDRIEIVAVDDYNHQVFAAARFDD